MVNDPNESHPPTKGRTSTFAIISLVLGIVSLLLMFFPVVGIVFSIIGVVLAVIALKEIGQLNKDGKGLAIAGLVLSGVALIISCLVSLIVIFSYYKSNGSDFLSFING